VNPGGESGWDEPPLDIQIPDDARELERDMLAYHRELRAKRRRSQLRKLTRPFAGQSTVMPLLASILAVCLVAGAMLSVATFGPATAPETHTHPSATAVSGLRSATQRSGPENSAAPTTSGATAPGAIASGASASAATTSGASASAASASAGASGRGGTARPSGSANSSARSGPSVSAARPTTPGPVIPPGGSGKAR
jgi:hypothetical protein